MFGSGANPVLGETIIVEVVRLFQKGDHLGDDLFRVCFLGKLRLDFSRASVSIGKKAIGGLFCAVDKIGGSGYLGRFSTLWISRRTGASALPRSGRSEAFRRPLDRSIPPNFHWSTESL